MKHPISFLNTRPVHQSGALNTLLAEHNIEVIECPTMQIVANPLNPSQAQSLKALSQFDALFVTSVNALVGWVNQFPEQFVMRVKTALAEKMATGRLDFAVQNYQLKEPLSCPVFAIGEATAQAAKTIGLQVQTLPRKQFDSEDLLEQLSQQFSQRSSHRLPQFQKKSFPDKQRSTKVGLLSGVGGREVIKNNLIAWDCQVEEFALYRREPTVFCQSHWQRFIQATCPVLLISSLESWQNLFQQLVAFDQVYQSLNASTWQRIQKVIVFSQRIAEALHQQGWPASKLVVVDIQSNQGILHALQSL